MKIDTQRIRNLTTGILHTKMSDIYEDIETLTGVSPFTHQLPGLCRALEPHLRRQLPDPRLWNDKHDPSHTGSVDVQPIKVQP